MSLMVELQVHEEGAAGEDQAAPSSPSGGKNVRFENSGGGQLTHKEVRTPRYVGGVNP